MTEENRNYNGLNEESSENYRTTYERPQTVVETARKDRKKGYAWLIWTLVTVLLCTVCSFATASYVSNKILKEVDTEQTVIYQNTGTEKTVINMTNTDLSEIVASVENSVVEVYTESVKYNSFYGEYVTSGAGSGVIMTADGYIITNNHVISGARSIRVALHDGSDYEAVLIGKDADLDIAVLKIDAEGLSYATFGESSSLKVGQTCIAIGNPLGTLGGTVTTGVISSLSRDITIDGKRMTLLQTDTTINPGNSGGGLFDVAGNLIGIVNAKYSSEQIEGIGFAIPIDSVKDILNELITNGKVTGKPVIGISCSSVENERYMSYYGVSRYGVYVNEVTLETAYKAGLRSGDLIIKLEKYEIEGFEDLQDALSHYKAGDSVSITVLRDNKEVTFKVLLSERSE